jgi:hypothetical protein
MIPTRGNLKNHKGNKRYDPFVILILTKTKTLSVFLFLHVGLCEHQKCWKSLNYCYDIVKRSFLDKYQISKLVNSENYRKMHLLYAVIVAEN